jgi:hypothetical protein
VFVRHGDGSRVDPDQPLPEDAVVDAEVAETLEDLAVDPDSRAARRLLTRYVVDAAAADPRLAGVLEELVAQAPPATVAGMTTSGSISQANTGGVNIANTGIARDVTAHGEGR